MHELSLAESLVTQVLKHVPPGGRVQKVHLRCGPLRGVDSQAMQWAWQAASAQTACAASELRLEQLSWRLSCPDCGREFEAEEMFATCACGGRLAHPVGGDELFLMSIEVEEGPSDPSVESACKSKL